MFCNFAKYNSKLCVVKIETFWIQTYFTGFMVDFQFYFNCNFNHWINLLLRCAFWFRRLWLHLIAFERPIKISIKLKYSQKIDGSNGAVLFLKRKLLNLIRVYKLIVFAFWIKYLFKLGWINREKQFNIRWLITSCKRLWTDKLTTLFSIFH